MGSVEVESASAYFACSTPTSSLGSPRGFMESEAHQCGTCLPHGCEGCGEVQSCAYHACARTRLTSAAPSFQPAVNNGNDINGCCDILYSGRTGFEWPDTPHQSREGHQRSIFHRYFCRVVPWLDA